MHMKRFAMASILSTALLATMVGCDKKEEAAGTSGSIDKSKAVMLRGESKAKEEIMISEFAMDDMKMNMEMEGMKISGTMSQRSKSKEKFEYVSADSIYYTVIYDSTFEKTEMMGQKEDKADGSALEGVKLLKVKKGDKWSFVVDPKLTSAQKAALKDIDANEGENDDELYSDKAVKVGDSWEVKADALKEFLGAGAEGVTGKVKMTFKDIVDYNGEQCALVEGMVKIGGQVEGEMEMNLDTKVSVYRSLKTFKDLKMEMDGAINGGMKAMNMTMAGTIKGTTTSEIN